MNKLILFDIDRTLLRCLKSHRAAFSRAFHEVYGIKKTSIDIVEYSGMTDKNIAMSVLKKKGLKEEDILTEFEECKRVMRAVFKEVINPDDIIVLKGIRELLAELEGRNVLMGLVTGNLEEIGTRKLMVTGLDRYFKVGGFGDDHLDRARLVETAIKKAEEQFGFKHRDNTYMIGDTIQDVKAGKDAGVKTIGVATGHYSREELQGSGADYVLDDLGNTEEVLKILSV